VTSVGLNHNIWLLGARLGGRCVMEEILRAVRDPDLAWRNFQKINPDRAAFDKLWQATGVKRLLAGLFGSLPLAGDRHTCENFGFLNPLPAVLESLGCKYTTIEERRERWLPPMKAKTQAIAAGTDQDYALKCSHEPVAPILAALHTGRPWRLEAGNLVNAGQISNLPRGAVVETPCLVSASGIEPVCVGDVPDPLAAFLTGHALRQKMVVEAALSADRSLALAALASDPLVTNAATCEAMLDELMDRTAQWLPQFYPEGRVPRRKRTAARGSSAPLADGADSLPAEISDRS
jgi:alpha-galactosidase